MSVLIPNVRICGIEIFFRICYLPVHFSSRIHASFFASFFPVYSPALAWFLPDDHTNINFTVMFT